MVRIHSGPSPAAVLHRPVVNDVSATRVADGTIYQNTSGRPIMVLVGFQCTRANAVNAIAYAFARMENVTPPTDLVTNIGLGQLSNSLENMYCQMTFMVPNNYYYLVNTNVTVGGLANVISWYEIEL